MDHFPSLINNCSTVRINEQGISGDPCTLFQFGALKNRSIFPACLWKRIVSFSQVWVHIGFQAGLQVDLHLYARRPPHGSIRPQPPCFQSNDHTNDVYLPWKRANISPPSVHELRETFILTGESHKNGLYPDFYLPLLHLPCLPLWKQLITQCVYPARKIISHLLRRV